MNIEIILKELENHDVLNGIEDIYLLDYIKKLQQENKQLKERIDKAIEYIDQYWYWDGTGIDELEEILKGDSNEN